MIHTGNMIYMRCISFMLPQAVDFFLRKMYSLKIQMVFFSANVTNLDYYYFFFDFDFDQIITAFICSFNLIIH